MKKEYFTQLFDYDKYVNLQIVDLMAKSVAVNKTTELMAHLLAAQQIWLNRCLSKPMTVFEIWPKWQPETFPDIIDSNWREWVSFINSETDLTRIIAYKNSRGEKFSAALPDILAHVINHGTHHRAQIGLLLKQEAGIDLPYTDYIYYALNNR